MNKRWLYFLLAAIATGANAGNVLMIDLNNSTNEVKACQDGVAANNQKVGGSDQVFVVGGGDRVTAQTVKQKIDELGPGANIDTIVISGHDGSGDFFGNDPRNSFLATDLKNIVNSHPELKNSLTGMALWGCYTGNANAAENFWMKKISPNIKATIGFTLQSPDNTRPGNWALLQDYCTKRGQIADAVTKQDIESSFNGLKGIGNWNVGVCYKDGICSPDYNKVGDPPKSCFHSYDELTQRCKDFDPDGQELQQYQNYMAAKPPFDKVPPDGEDEYVSQGLDARNAGHKSPIRVFYGQLHLWRHCADQLKHDTSRGQAGYQMPLPAQVIRLTKFDTLKKNFAKVQQPLLNQYNLLMRQLGLGDYTLDLPNMTRGQIVDRIEKGEAALTQMSRTGTLPQLSSNSTFPLFNLFSQGGQRNNTGIDPSKLLTMAQGFDRSLRMLDWVCTDFTYVHDNATKPSPCLAAYGKVPEWQGQ